MAKKQVTEAVVEEVVVDETIISEVPSAQVKSLPSQKVELSEQKSEPEQIGHATRAFRS